MEWHPGLPALLGGETTVGLRHDGARALLGDVYDALAEFHLEITEVRDLDDRLLAFGRMRARGRESGAETESPWAYLVRYENGKAIEIGPTSTPRRRSMPRGCRTRSVHRPRHARPEAAGAVAQH